MPTKYDEMMPDDLEKISMIEKMIKKDLDFVPQLSSDHPLSGPIAEYDLRISCDEYKPVRSLFEIFMEKISSEVQVSNGYPSQKDKTYCISLLNGDVYAKFMGTAKKTQKSSYLLGTPTKEVTRTEGKENKEIFIFPAKIYTGS